MQKKKPKSKKPTTTLKEKHTKLKSKNNKKTNKQKRLGNTNVLFLSVYSKDCAE